jgi:hypothetical protein
MPNEIKDKFSTSAALTITVASLADASGRQSTLIDNGTTRYQDLLVYVKLKMGTTAPTANSVCEVFLIRGDKDATTEHISDGAGTTDAALTVLNTPLVGVVRNKTAPAAGDVLYGEFLIHRPGPKWGVAVINRTGQTLDATGSNHWVRYVGLNPEVQ